MSNPPTERDGEGDVTPPSQRAFSAASSPRSRRCARIRSISSGIVHEKNAPAFYDTGPFSNYVRAPIARNELHMWVVPSYEPADFVPLEITMLGPIRGD